MAQRRLKKMVELVAVVSIVASLIFVGLQLRQDKEIAAAQVFVESDGLVFELSQMVNENREVWLRGLTGEELSDLDEITFQTLAKAVYARHSGIAQRVNRLDTGSATNRASRYAYTLYQNPGLRRVFMEHMAIEDRHNAAMRSMSSGQTRRNSFAQNILNALAELDEVAPPVSGIHYTPY